MTTRATGWGGAIRVAAAIGAAALLASGCAAPERAPRSVFFVTIDTLRPDHLGAYGHPAARTPHLDALARRGAAFTDARVPYPLTLPSHASLLTGRLPYEHGARRNDSFAYDGELPTMPGRLAAAGRATGAIVSTFVLNRNFGLDAPFGTFLDLSDLKRMREGRNERRADEVTDLARAWLRDRPDSSFFLWAHYFDPHDDYEPPRPFDTLYAGDERTLYDGEIAYTDFEFGRLLRALDLRDDAADRLTVLTSDHGEAFGEHQEWGHGYFLYDTTIRVPLLFAEGPGRAGGGGGGSGRAGGGWLHRGLVRSIDVFPTVCALTGDESPADLPGRSLDPFGRGPVGTPPLYLETFDPTVAYGATDLRGLVDGDWKWIHAPIPELYDLAGDPHELENLEGAEPETEAELRARLEEHFVAERAAGRSAGADARVDEETRDRLLALGYLTSGAEDEAATGWSRRDPKEIVHLIGRMYEGIKHCRNDRWEQGIPLLESVLEEDPINGKALRWVGRARAREGGPEDEIAVYRRAIEHDPANPGLLNTVAMLHLRARQPEEAIVALETAVDIDPRHVAAWINLASAYAQLRKGEKSVAAVQRALQVDPTNPMARQIAKRFGLPVEER